MRKASKRQRPAPEGDDEAPILLARIGKTRIEFAQTNEPWALGTEGLVVPTDRGRQLGELGHALLEHQSPGTPLRRALLLELSNTEPYGPDEVLVVQPEQVNGIRLLICVAPFLPEQPSPTEAAARRASVGAIHAAAIHGCRSLVLPVLGVGAGGLEPQLGARAVVSALRETPATVQLERVVLTTLDEETAMQLHTLLAVHAQSFANDAPGGEDLLRVRGELNALTDMLLLRDTTPPLVVGVLGGWGSGKSFAMHLMRERILEVRSWPVSAAEAWDPKAQDSAAQVGHIYPITFDAWTFAKGNLWASLMQTVFLELDRQRSLEGWAEQHLGPQDEGSAFRLLVDLHGSDVQSLKLDPNAPEALRRVLKKDQGPAGQGALWDQLRGLQKQDRQQLLEVEAGLAEARAKLASEENELAREVDTLLATKMRRAAWKPIADEFANLFGKISHQSVVELHRKLAESGAVMPSVDEIAANVSLFRRLLALPRVELLCLLLFALVTATVPFLIGAWHRELVSASLPSWLLSASTVALTVYRGLDSFAKRIRPLQERYEASIIVERQRIAGEREELIRARLAQAERADAAEDLAPLGKERKRVRELESRAAALRARVSLTANYVSFAELVRARLDSALYAQHLGLVHQVQQDLIELTQSLVADPREPNFASKQKQFRRGPPRVVLFIDDLDRCPPETVVAVLEAAQLLVKTKLFVVVIAMDVRYVTRTLEKHYAGVLVRNGDPSGLDYIEKIIQIPYRVRPIGPEALREYLQGQMRIVTRTAARTGGRPSILPDTSDSIPVPGQQGEPQVAVSGAGRVPAQALAFTPDESELLARCCERLDLTPRALKRLVNVYRVLKILWCCSSAHQQPAPESERAVMFLLALSCRYSDTLREAFDKIAVLIPDPVASNQSVVELLCRLEPDIRDPLRKRSHEEMCRVVRNTRLILPEFTVARLGGPTFDLVRSFAFLGDSGLEPGDITFTNGAPELQEATPERADDKAAVIAKRAGGPV